MGESLKCGRLIRKLQQLRVGDALAHDFRIGRALLRGDAAVCDRLDPLDRTALFYQELRPGHEKRQTEVDALAARLSIGHRFGDQIRGVCGEQRNARLRRRFLFIEFHLLVQFFLNRR